jgi:hypothetical protein
MGEPAGLALRTLDGSLGVAIINLLGEGAEHLTDPKGTISARNSDNCRSLLTPIRPTSRCGSQLPLTSRSLAG